MDTNIPQFIATHHYSSGSISRKINELGGLFQKYGFVVIWSIFSAKAYKQLLLRNIWLACPACFCTILYQIRGPLLQADM